MVKHLRMKELLSIVGLSKSEIYRRINAGTFPSPHHLGPKVAYWRTDEITAWQDEQLLLPASLGVIMDK